MTIFQDLRDFLNGGRARHFWWKTVLSGALLAGWLLVVDPAGAQVVASANAGGYKVSVGGTGSGFYVQYGERKMLGVSAFVDADTQRGIGLEGEARWLEFHQTGDVHLETYSAGVRYHMNFRKFQPYVKGLIGLGNVNFAYNGGYGSYLVATAGGGVDYRLNRRIHIRVADVEYQMWPQFTLGSMSTVGVSAGLRVGIF